MQRKGEEVPKSPERNPTWRETLRGEIRQATRRFNKLVGRPGTDEARIVANLLEALIKETEPLLGSQRSITGVAVSTPYLSVSIQEYVQDAADYLRIKILAPSGYYSSLQEFEVAYAAAGFGLCENYRDVRDCENEEACLPSQNVLGLSFNAASVGVYCGNHKEAMPDYSHAVQKPSLGYREKPYRQTGSEKEYWDEFRDLIIKVVETQLSRYKWRPDILLIFGDAVEAATDELAQVIGDALRSLFPGNADALNIETLISRSRKGGDDYIFSPARGAAKFARRFQGQPDNCFESRDCKASRLVGTKGNINGGIIVQAGF
ncbi:hypothetical protein ABW20_dc0107954 [Dactylellina cionopaga]|nr:hypothetical protein ABW20_dc0107954 [Dactylellina cionopaga]